MPAPPPPLISAIAAPALVGAGIAGAMAPMLAIGLGICTSAALMAFIPLCQASPGQPTAVDPITLSGSTAGPGPLVGALPAGLAGGLADVAFKAQGLLGVSTPRLAVAYGEMLSQGVQLFVGSVKVRDGAAVVGAATTTPGTLMGTPPSKSDLQPICLDALTRHDIRGASAEALAGVLAEVIAGSLLALMGMVTVMPGVACPPVPPVTASAGVLV